MFEKILIGAMLSVALIMGTFHNPFAKSNTDILPNFVIDKVYDGDTIYITFKDIPDILGKKLGLRLSRIDAPEINDKDTCIRGMAEISQKELTSFIAKGRKFEIVHVKRDKYFRLDADLLVDGKSASQHMLEVKRAQFYDGKGAKPLWVCQLDWFN